MKYIFSLMMLISFNILWHPDLYSQILPTAFVSPSSPQAYEFTKHSFLKANYYRGLPDINIPIHTVTAGNLEVPINLSYNYNGYKIKEMASNTGLGWSLNFGGVITRSVNGKPDESPNGYDNVKVWMSIPDPINEHNKYLTWLSNITDQHKRNIANGDWDAIPDVYFLSLNGISVKLIKLNNGEYFSIPYQPLKIQRPNHYQWIITDPSGNKYTYGKLTDVDLGGIERSNVDISHNGNPEEYSYTSAWMLRKIETPQNEVINFNYEQETITLPESVQHSLYHNTSGIFANQVCTSANIPQSTTINVTTVNSQRISSISSPTEVIEINANTIRADLNFIGDNAKRIDEVLIKDKSNIRKRKLKLNYHYLNSNRRLMLGSVKEYGETDATFTPPYVFTYDESISVPSNNSYAQDHWGYYNGEDGNTTLIPDFLLKSNYNYYFQTGVDRSPNENYAKLGVLTNVEFPTGGETAFFYEANDFGYNNHNEVPETYESIEERYSESYVEYTSGPEQDLTFFVLDFDQTVEIEYDVDLNRPIDDDIPYVQITKNISEVVFNKYGQTSGNQPLNLQAGIRYTVKAMVYENTDKALIRVKYHDSETHQMTKAWKIGGLRLSRIEESDGESNPRIKTFQYKMPEENDRSSGVIINEPWYESTQHVTSVHNYKFGPCDPTPCYTVPLVEANCTAIGRYGSSIINLQSGGSHVGYRVVKVFEGESGENGSTEYHFTTAFNFKDIDFPVSCPVISNEHYRGKLIEEIIYNSTGDKITQKEYNYEFNNDPVNPPRLQEGIAGIFNIDYVTDDPQNLIDQFTQPHFGIISSEWIYLEDVTTTIYDPSGQNPVETVVKYYYDHEDHAQLSRKSQTTSDNSLIWQHTLYPHDYTNTTGFIGEMKTKNIVSKPIESVTYKSNDTGGSIEILSANIITYNTGNLSGLPNEIRILETELPIDLSDFKFSNQISTGILPQSGTNTAFNLNEIDNKYPQYAKYIPSYYSFGKIKQEYKKGNIYSAYLWSYNHQYPVAKIENASFTEVESAVSNISSTFITSLGQSNSQSYIDTKLSQLRTEVLNDLPNAQITTYTYDPLVGMTSQTDPAGVTIYYEYDDLGRLKNVRDYDEKILNHTEYHYAE